MKKIQKTRRQSKEIIYNVYNHLKDLTWSRPDATVRELFTATQIATAQACGITFRTVQRICAEADRTAAAAPEDEAAPAFSEPKTNTLARPVTDLDEFEKSVARQVVLEVYDRGEHPTLARLLAGLVEKINYSGSLTSVKRIYRDLGFRYKMCVGGRRYLLEKTDTAAARMRFLRKMHQVRLDRRQVVYLDETWVSANPFAKFKSLSSIAGQGGLKVPLESEPRLIVCHAGSSIQGQLIPSAKLIIESESKMDYREDMNSDVFRDWFVDLLMGLEEPCVIVMDNASYHSARAETIPSAKTKKADIVSWLASKGIPHDPSHTRPELLDVVKGHRDRYKTYEVDAIAFRMGHEVVRLPPYHATYNPIELVWAQVRREIAARHRDIERVRELLEEALSDVSLDDWRQCVAHAENLQEEDLANAGIRDDMIERIVGNLREDIDSSFSGSEEEELFEV